VKITRNDVTLASILLDKSLESLTLDEFLYSIPKNPIIHSACRFIVRLTKWKTVLNGNIWKFNETSCLYLSPLKIFMELNLTKKTIVWKMYRYNIKCYNCDSIKDFLTIENNLDL